MSTLRAVITPSKGAITRSKSVSSWSRWTVACWASRLASRDRDAGLGAGDAGVAPEAALAVELSAFCRVSQPWLASVVCAVFCDVGELGVGLGLGEAGLGLEQRRLVLAELGLRLGELLIEVGRGDAHQQVALVHPAADIDAALGDVAGGAGKDVGGVEGDGLARQGEFDRLVHALGLRDAHLGDEILLLPAGSAAASAWVRQWPQAPQRQQRHDGDGHVEPARGARRWRRGLAPSRLVAVGGSGRGRGRRSARGRAPTRACAPSSA